MYVLASSGQSSCNTQLTDGKSEKEMAKYLFELRKHVFRISDLVKTGTSLLSYKSEVDARNFLYRIKANNKPAYQTVQPAHVTK